MADSSLRTLVVSTELEPRTTHGSGVWFRHSDAFWRLNVWTVRDAVTRGRCRSLLSRSLAALTSPGGALAVTLRDVAAVVAISWGQDVDWHERLPLWP